MLNEQFNNNLLSRLNMISLTKQKDISINKHKELNKRLYVFTKNSKYSKKKLSFLTITMTNERKKQSNDNGNTVSIKKYRRIVIPNIKGDDGKMKPHKSAYIIQKEKINNCREMIYKEKNAKAKEIHNESNLFKINTMIIHEKSIEYNKAKKRLIDIRMFVGRNSKDYYSKMKKEHVNSQVKYELMNLEDKNKQKQKEIDIIIKNRALTVS